jgi:hypothetical protein
MNTLRKTILTLGTVALLSSSVALASDGVRGNMISLLSAFRGIQPYLVDQDRFSDSDNRKQIAELIQDLRKNFHHLEEIPSNYKSLPGFTENVKLVADLLDDSSRRLSEGKVAYAWWRLRKLPTDCFTCHTTYKVSSHYSNKDVVDQSLAPLNRGRFLLATRQFTDAQVAFLEVLKDPEFRFNYDEVLRSLLLITTRINKSPQTGITTFKEILATSKLPEEDAREVQSWIGELTKWSEEKPSEAKNSLAFGEKLITKGVALSPDTIENDVALLRGTAILHEQLEGGALKPAQRSRALYLLGYAYLQLPLFFAEDWSEMYLERCITEFPGTKDAQSAYRAYRDHILDDYTGAGGTNLPAEIRLQLEDLRRKAHGEPLVGDMANASVH